MIQTSPVSSISYLERAKNIVSNNKREQLFYAALELRCGIEARLQEEVRSIPYLSKAKYREWKITNLSRTLEENSGFGDSILVIFLTLEDGSSYQFLYAPVTKQLQKIGKRCGDYLHALKQDQLEKEDFWEILKNQITEGCQLLEFACSTEVLSPNKEKGFHFILQDDDSRNLLIEKLNAGQTANLTTLNIKPEGPMTFYKN